MFKLDKQLSDIVGGLSKFWKARNVKIIAEENVYPAGAATFSLNTVYFVQRYQENVGFLYPCYRPHDHCSALHLKQYLQFQILLRLEEDILPDVIQSIESLTSLDISKNITVEGDHWSAPTMGAFGDGWEIRLNNIEVIQVTYFTRFLGEKLANYSCVEISYGIERLAMMLSNGNSLIQTIFFPDIPEERLTNDEMILELRQYFKKQMSYTEFMRANLLFNILDSRHIFNEDIKSLYMYKIKSMFENYSTT